MLRVFFFFCLVLCALVAGGRGQILREQPTPFSVYLDVQGLTAPGAPRVALPLWLESLRVDRRAGRTAYRLHLRPIGSLNNEILLRVFFDDLADAPPIVTAWTETGTLRYEVPPLGSGLGLPTSTEVVIPVEGVDYVEVAVEGDGSHVQGLWVATSRRGEQRHAFDFALPGAPVSAFGNLPASTPPAAEDQFLFGRVRALLEPGPLPLNPGVEAATVLDFELDRQPLLALLTFEVLNADVGNPLRVSVNDRPSIGATVHLPDLADPGFRGVARPREGDLRYRYSGWLRAQVVVPGSALRPGLNTVKIELDKAAGSAAVRAVELQLKHPWRNLDLQSNP